MRFGCFPFVEISSSARDCSTAKTQNRLIKVLNETLMRVISVQLSTAKFKMYQNTVLVTFGRSRSTQCDDRLAMCDSY